MLAFLKKNKLMVGIIGVLIVFVAMTSILGHHHVAKRAQQQSRPLLTDQVSGDTTAESLNALTQQLHAVIHSNASLQKNNAALAKRNDHILRNIRAEVQKNLDDELQQRGQNNQAKITQLTDDINAINAQLQTLHAQQVTGLVGSDHTGLSSGLGAMVLNGQHLVAIADVASTSSAMPASSAQTRVPPVNTGSLLHTSDTTSATESIDTQKTGVPYYTIPNSATLAGAVNMTSLIGRVPVDGVVKSPYPFKILLGRDNMATNGLSIPGVSGAIVQGYTVGDMALSCVKGYIISITFTFPDGTISTTSIPNSATTSNLGFDNALGYLSTPTGNPCISGKFYTNAPTYLGTMIALGAINQGGKAYSMAQQTTTANIAGGSTSALTGDISKYMLGGALSGGTQQAMDWYTAREKNSFDAVYVPAGKKVVINITKEIPINYNPKGRKINYDQKTTTQHNTSLD